MTLLATDWKQAFRWREVVSFRVDGRPVAQPRMKARLVTPHGRKPFISVYTPAVVGPWKKLIYIAAMRNRPPAKLEGPVRVDLDFLMPRPQRLCRKSDPPGRLPCPCIPDRDNLDKAVLDELSETGVFWDNDGQVCGGAPEKWYHAIGEGPGVEIRISVLETQQQLELLPGA